MGRLRATNRDVIDTPEPGNEEGVVAAEAEDSWNDESFRKKDEQLFRGQHVYDLSATSYNSH